MKGKLILEDGTVFEGTSVGHPSSTAGEVVFTTAMVGYPESLTDPSYAGQILTFTYPLIGNYGVPLGKKDEHGIAIGVESDRIHAKGVIICSASEEFSHWNSTTSIRDWLMQERIPALDGIDTRALTIKLRDKGTLLGKIIVENEISEQSNNPDRIPWCDPNKENHVGAVSIKQPKIFGNGRFKVIAVDCGMKNNIIRRLLKRDVTIKQVPWNYDYTKEEYDGVLVSNGPGDPTMYTQTIRLLQTAMEQQKPIFGICLGHQLLALAAGARTYKLKYGHRSHNQPCTTNGRGYITSQNHGFAVNAASLPQGWQETFVNANDQTNEGIRHITLPFFSVQFHPEGRGGPIDTDFLFDDFISLLQKSMHKGGSP